jgi:Na+-transporting NADH:ubiquinone oxidoreductase subunit NqrB
MDTPLLSKSTHSLASGRKPGAQLAVAITTKLVNRLRDPRYYQIAVLSTLLTYGITKLGFRVSLAEISLLVIAALATQIIWGRIFSVPFDSKSPLISALSLSLLARSGSIVFLSLTAVAAISSKFLIRRRGKHIFNPTNFGLVAIAVLSGRVWISPGQWGSGAILAFLVACLGMLVVHRSARSDVTWAFLVSYAAILFGRTAWLGDPWSIPWHDMNSGALLIFAFFMISDPKTTPDTRLGRISYAAIVAVGAGFVHFVLFQPNGFIWSLICCAPFVPIIDRLFPGAHYRWPKGQRVLTSPLHSPQPTYSGGTKDAQAILNKVTCRSS